MLKSTFFINGILFLFMLNSSAQIKTQNSKIKNSPDMKSLQIVNKYLDIIFVENNNGEGLSNILADDFVFDDPFTRATGAQDFINKTKNWIKTKKSIHMQTQFAEGNKVCSIYSIEILTPSGNIASFQLADYIELTGEKISKEIVYFKDPVNFAKAMGFKDDYLKQY